VYNLYEKFFQTIRNVADVDVFISTWSNIGYRGYMFGKEKGPEIDIEDIINTYKPVDILVDDIDNYQELFIDIGKHGEKSTNMDKTQGFSMYNRIKSCNHLKRTYELKNNFRYDLVIRLRPDLSLTEPYFALDTKTIENFLQLADNELSIWSRPDDINIDQPSDIFFLCQI
jgi:hypothetical protein